MPFKLNIYLLTICSFLFLNFFSNAQEDTDIKTTDTLLVGISGSEPFVFDKGEIQKGIALEIWEELAEEKKLDFHLSIL